MRRREFILLVGGTAAVWSSRVHGQHPAIPTIGWLNLASDTAARPMSEAFRSGLAALGYKEGDNIRVLYRYADGHAERLSALASELVSLGAMVIVTNGGSSIQATALAAQPATIKVASLRVYPRLAGHPWGRIRQLVGYPPRRRGSRRRQP